MRWTNNETGICVCIGVCTVAGLLLGMQLGAILQVEQMEQVRRWDHAIPSPMELQRFLGVDDDGVIGPATMDAWTGYIYNEKAKPYMEDVNFIERQDDVWK